MFLSIITVNYNNIKGLKNTFSSLKTQSNILNFEWIIIDGNSTDGSLEYIISLDNTFSTTIISEDDKGIYDAMNKGINISNGDYLLFLNSGDTFFNINSFDHISFEILNNRNFDLYMFGFQYENKVRYPKPLFWRFWSLPTSHQALIYKKHLFLPNLYSLEYRLGSDLDHFLALIKAKIKVRSIRKILISNESYGSNNNLDILKIEYIKIYSKYIGYNTARFIMHLRFKYLNVYFKK